MLHLITKYCVLVLFLLIAWGNAHSQKQINILDQNITIKAEDRPVKEIIKYICDEFDLDYNYNSKFIKGKRISLNVSNKSVGEILDKLMEDFYLIFEIEDDLLLVRDYVPLSQHIDFEKLYQSESSGFIFDNPQKKTATIKFKQISNLIVIPVSINGSDTMNFILDTGIKTPIITELTMVDDLELNYMKPVRVKGLGGEISTQAYQSGANTITLPGLSASKQVINVVIDDNFQISQILGLPVHGLIGFNLFRHYVVKIDYKSEEIKLYKPQFWDYKPRKNDIVLPIHFINSKPMVRTEIVQDSLETIPVMLLLDTGASDALWLSVKSNSKIKVPSQCTYTYLGTGLGGDLYGNKGRLSGLWIGGKVLEEPIASYPDNEYIQNLMINEQRQGTIGGELLRRFTLWFDYFNNRIILRPNSDFKDDFNYNMSGLEVINPVPGVPLFTINNVVENSPADVANLKVNDQIIKLNNKLHTELTLNDINLVLRKAEGKKIRLTILRNGETIKTSFTLEEIL